MADTSSNSESDMSPQRATASSSQRTTTNRVRTRGLMRIKWSAQEKEIIYTCFSYSRSERWGRNKAQIFQEQLSKSSLNKEKLERITIAKLNSLMSQIGVYLSPQRIDEIKTLALQKAEEDFARETAEEREKRKAGWTEEEKWTILWATEYAKKKYGTNKSKEYTKMWRIIMAKYYPDKRNHANNTTQLANVKKSGVFSDKMTYLTELVEQYIAQQKDPLAEPMKMPDRATNAPPATPTMASTRASEPACT